MTRAIDEERKAHDPNYAPPAPEWTFEVEDAARLCIALASGQADSLTGRMIHVRDDLDEMIKRSKEIVENDEYALRLTHRSLDL